MAKGKQKDPFWTSYSDLMTSLFFVMLVLFIICLVKVGGMNGELKRAYKEAIADKQDLENILHLEDQFKVLSESSSLEYDSIRKMFYAKDFQEKEIFYSNDDKIKPEYLEIVDTVGNDILQILQSLNENENFNYQMVIEGNAAIKWQNLKSGNYNPDNVEMYHLSYNRALALYLYWKSKGIDFRKYNTEVIIAGSGFNGINRDNKVEDYNKRFIIQIIPKINRPKAKKQAE
ncbi:hypothetical protein CIK92_09160 [Prevotella sp. P4-67]|uniref:hypothetical protein n=1 Tax=Prevotella sp. P4-67 TaxID=2024227 RepID=UPI000B9627DC|nr:hypothetical protein [Prevotella sp. P4-67]OYP70642.1 hypothetical protein CIK92_09160 [Prevotella sp. P4-67]